MGSPCIEKEGLKVRMWKHFSQPLHMKGDTLFVIMPSPSYVCTLSHPYIAAIALYDQLSYLCGHSLVTSMSCDHKTIGSYGHILWYRESKQHL